MLQMALAESMEILLAAMERMKHRCLRFSLEGIFILCIRIYGLERGLTIQHP